MISLRFLHFNVGLRVQITDDGLTPVGRVAHIADKIFSRIALVFQVLSLHPEQLMHLLDTRQIVNLTQITVISPDVYVLFIDRASSRNLHLVRAFPAKLCLSHLIYLWRGSLS